LAAIAQKILFLKHALKKSVSVIISATDPRKNPAAAA
jgi:hypothetical protein